MVVPLKTLFLKKIDPLIGGLLVRALPTTKPSLVAVSRILMIRPGGIGDVVHLIPCISTLHSAFPAAQIDILAERRNASAFDLCPGVGNVYCFDRISDIATVFCRRYDVVIDTEQWHRLSAVVARLIPAKLRIGYATNERAQAFQATVEYLQDELECFSFLRLLEPLGLMHAQAVPFPFLHVPQPAKIRSQHLLAGISKPLVTIFPGASISERQWGQERFAALAAQLARAGISVVVVGGSVDHDQGVVIARCGCGLNLAGKTSLAETAAVIEIGRAHV